MVSSISILYKEIVYSYVVSFKYSYLILKFAHSDVVSSIYI